jgi:hypothetical protein
VYVLNKDATNVALAIRDAINGVGSGLLITATASSSVVSLTADNYGDGYPITTTETRIGVSGMSGGRRAGDCPTGTGCTRAEDCASLLCDAGVCVTPCAPPLAPIETAVAGFYVCAYRRTSDNAILLAHYRNGNYVVGFDQMTTQGADAAGGSPVGANWGPDPYSSLGHLAYRTWSPSGKQVILECGPTGGGITTTVATALFTSFASGVKGTYGTAGTPGWASIASEASDLGRATAGMCGTTTDATVGGIGACTGNTATWTANLVSYSTNGTDAWVGCGGVGCNGDGTSCSYDVLVWLK